MVDARQQARDLQWERLGGEVEARCAARPALFALGREAPELSEALWRLAEGTYLDNPLPSLFKERLFAYLSRFSRSRYNVARHSATLLGLGRVAGDPYAPPLVLREVLDMFEAPAPDEATVEERSSQLEALPGPLRDWPSGGSDEEGAVIACAAAVFLRPARAERALRALAHALGGRRHEQLLALLSFIRVAQFWAEVHPELEMEGDVQALLRERGELADAVLNDPEAGRSGLDPEEHADYVRLREEMTVLRRDHEQLEESHRRKDDFIGVLVHELRNPLATIQSASDLLARGAGQPELLERIRGVLDRNTRSLGQLLHELSDVNRLARGTLTLEWERLDLRDVVAARAQARRGEVEETGVTLNVELPAEPLGVRGDQARLEQVIDQLLANALEQTPPQGWIRLSGASVGEWVEVSVRDSGAGFEPELSERVFEPFLPGPGAVERPAGVLGLGLSLVKGLVELHGGEVAAFSEGPGRGSELVVHLPLAGERAQPEPRAQAAEAAASVLLVEDSPDFADSFSLLLRTVGHEVFVASTGAEGISMARALRPDVVICDIGLPDRSGYEVAAALREDPTLAHVRLIGLSGYGEPRSSQRAQQAGFEAFLAKPISLEEVEEVLQALTAA